MTDEGHPDVEGTSVGQLIGEVTKDLSTLMRQELELAKAEMKVEAKKAGQGAGAVGAAGFAGDMVQLLLSLALWWALENVMDAGLAALIVAILWGIVAAIGFVVGKKKFQQVNPKPERTVETLQQVPGALKPNS
jgi:flagellar motor component MotA